MKAYLVGKEDIMGLPALWARMSNQQRIVSVVGLGMTSTLVFCCGGLGALGAIVGPAPSKSSVPSRTSISVASTRDERPETPLTESHEERGTTTATDPVAR